MYIQKGKHRRTDPVTGESVIKTQIQLVESYRPSPGAAPKKRIIRSCGYLEDQADPAAFLAALKKEIELAAADKPREVTIDANLKIDDVKNRDLKYAYFLLESVYRQTGLDRVIADFRDSKAQYNLNDIVRYLSIIRLIYPDSKRASFMLKEHIYGLNQDAFMLYDIYRSLDELCDMRELIQNYLADWIEKKYPSDQSYVYLDATNFYTEIDRDDEEGRGLRARGVSKERRVTPIVQMGLILNANGFPVLHECYRGNTHDDKMLQPMIELLRKRRNLPEKIIVVADKGLNNSKNIDYLVNEGCGFLFSQTIKGNSGKRYQEKLFDEKLYTSNKDGSYKWHTYIEEYQGTDSEGKKVTRKRKVLMYWSKENAEYDRAKREKKVKRAEKSIENAVYTTAKSKDRYIEEVHVDKQTGEVLDVKTVNDLNTDKIESDAKFDGYMCMITSELDYDEKKIRKVYHNLEFIEDTFGIDKSDLSFRPIYCHKESHIRGHFMACHISVFLMRLIQFAMGEDAISAERIQRVFQNMVLDMSASGYVHLHSVSGNIQFEKYLDKAGYYAYTLKPNGEDEVTNDFKLVQKALGIELPNAYEKIEVFNKKKKKIKLMLQNEEKKKRGRKRKGPIPDLTV